MKLSALKLSRKKIRRVPKAKKFYSPPSILFSPTTRKKSKTPELFYNLNETRSNSITLLSNRSRATHVSFRDVLVPWFSISLLDVASRSRSGYLCKLKRNHESDFKPKNNLIDIFVVLILNVKSIFTTAVDCYPKAPFFIAVYSKDQLLSLDFSTYPKN